MISKLFATAGNAVFTVSNPQGERFTFRLRSKEPTDKYPRPVTFASLFVGSENDNEQSYSYVGIFEPEGFSLRLTQASKFENADKVVRVLRWALALAAREQEEPEGYAIQHAGRCGRCGRTLTVPASISAGIGPDCAGIMGIDLKTASVCDGPEVMESAEPVPGPAQRSQEDDTPEARAQDIDDALASI